MKLAGPVITKGQPAFACIAAFKFAPRAGGGISAGGLNQCSGDRDKLSEAAWDSPSPSRHRREPSRQAGELCHGQAGEKAGSQGMSAERNLSLAWSPAQAYLWKWVSLKCLDGQDFRNGFGFVFFFLFSSLNYAFPSLLADGKAG